MLTEAAPIADRSPQAVEEFETTAAALIQGLESFATDHGSSLPRLLPTAAVAQFSELLGMSQALAAQLRRVQEDRQRFGGWNTDRWGQRCIY